MILHPLIVGFLALASLLWVLSGKVLEAHFKWQAKLALEIFTQVSKHRKSKTGNYRVVWGSIHKKFVSSLS